MEVGSLEVSVHHRQRLHGKWAVVTGAVSGTGRAIALRFAVTLPSGWTPSPTRRSCSEFPQAPAGRMAKASEIANVALFLPGGEASFVHGSVYTADGGWLIR
ncbi:SDR family oxidoreductase [Rhizobium ruizarguesonis]|jgi:NAD(P)-dependent dehydrogenase (short-subunit alcohol dehydrogenase family)|uniref:SDR family oxidoreductase n=1 Tax=Rhizobium ruizarguesonis TaxID=2081791 RepID=A0AAE8Q9Y1_9HYPH|nr:SDR family oxidoreductase [Rhizobium ruizarguesonis]QIJ43890.1 SDR family oxidoreductase [Rhizobium leguminosarum]QJS31026.1 SDR family oxidoreductase [Rhizobium leguminosarum bv. trifolii TA1]NEH30162.1 SDR family oxidoreductase [Rhizobium ruizarguesonis]NEI47311.1 SDR family oxidoreductase [Rhizobium ruizarguesonis]